MRLASADLKPGMSALLTVRTTGSRLPISVSGYSDGQEGVRTQLLINTFEHFCKPGTVDEFLIVTPATDRDEVAAICRKAGAGFKTRLLTDEEVCPALKKYSLMPGLWRQMVLKLAASRFIQNEFFLVLDADVICRRPLLPGDLIPDGRALLQLEPMAEHSAWWIAAAEALDVEVDLSSMGMSVTPAILSTQACRTLINHFSADHSEHSWVQQLFKCSVRSASRGTWKGLVTSDKTFPNWTEYTLYYLWCLKQNILHDYHDLSRAQQNPLHSSRSIWHTGDFSAQNIKAIFDGDEAAAFAVVQSSATSGKAELVTRGVMDCLND